MSVHALIYLIVFVVWIIRSIASAVAKAKKNQGINPSLVQRTPPIPPPVQQVRPVPQQFSAPVQSTPQYTQQPQIQQYAPPQRPVPQYVPPQQQYVQPQPQRVPASQQYGTYPPANSGQGPSPYSSPAPPASATFGPRDQGNYGAYAPTAAPAYGQQNDDPFGLYGQSRQDPNPVYGQPDYNSPAQPSASQARIQKARSSPVPKASVEANTIYGAETKQKTALTGLFASRNAIVRAVVLQEVLGPPKCKR